jgi:FkbM family methyltransferase
MFHCVNRLKINGYKPHVVLDIGAHRGFWTDECKKIYPDSDYFLFEPIDYPELKNHKNVFNVVLDKKEGEVDWYEMKNTGDSMYKEQTIHFSDCKPIKRTSTTLENVFGKLSHTFHSILIKIDCQGAEIPILQGAGKVLDKTDFIILEMPFFGQYNEKVPDFKTHIEYMDSIGFVPYDIADMHYTLSFLIQIDILFIKKSHPFNKQVADRLMNDY